MLLRINPDERRIWNEERQRVLATGEVDDSIWTEHYTKKPPGIEQFIDDDYYMGRVFRHSDDNEGLYPAWREILLRDFDLDGYVHNAVLTGSLSAGKSFVAVAILLYRLCLCTHLRNPVQFFGLTRGTRIVFNMLSVTKTAVTETVYGDAMSFMAQSPYFTEVCRFDPDQRYTKMGIPMLNRSEDGSAINVWLTAGSKGQHVLGRNVVACLLDEGNYRLEANPDQAAYDLYDQVRSRIKSRFQKFAGFLPAISIIASSASDASSFTENIIREIEESKDASQKVYRFALYVVKRHELKLKPWWFRVAYGLKNVEPCILSGYYNEDGTPYIGKERPDMPLEEPSPGARTELVPGDYYEDFKRNCTAQLQSLSGISTAATHKLFPSTLDIERCISLSEQEGVVSPCKLETFPISLEDKLNVWDYLDHKTFLTRVMSRVQPKRHPFAKRYVHLDLATQSQAGLAVCHLAGMQAVEGIINPGTGTVFDQYRVVVEYDFILGIVAGQSKPINLEKIQRFIFWLRDYCGFTFGLITADQYASAMPLQMLEASGFETDRLSIDKDKSAYHALRAGFQELRIRLYRHNGMLREAENLIDTGKMYDHTSTSTKDLMDSVAGAFWDAINSEEKKTYSVIQTPGVHTARTIIGKTAEELPPPIEIIMPEKGYTRKRVFSL